MFFLVMPTESIKCTPTDLMELKEPKAYVYDIENEHLHTSENPSLPPDVCMDTNNLPCTDHVQLNDQSLAV